MHDGWSRRRTAQPERAPPSSLQPELPRSLARRGNRPSFRSSIFQVPCSMLHAPKCVRPRPEMNTRARGLPRFGVMSVSPVMKHEVRRPLALVTSPCSGARTHHPAACSDRSNLPLWPSAPRRARWSGYDAPRCRTSHRESCACEDQWTATATQSVEVGACCVWGSPSGS